MPESTSPNYRYLKYATAILFAAGTLGVYFLLRRIPVKNDVFWPLFAGLLIPSAILGGLFIYKSRVGIKKVRLGLSRWALYVSLTFLPYHGLAWFYDQSHYPVYAAGMIAAQLANLVLASGPLRRQAGFLTMPFAYALGSYASQFVVMLIVALRYAARV